MRHLHTIVRIPAEVTLFVVSAVVLVFLLVFLRVKMEKQ